MNYLLEEFRTERYDATSKARRDINYFACTKLGFKPIAKLRGDKTTIGMYYDIIHSFYKIFLLKSSDTLLVQCPLELLFPILIIKKIKKFKLIYLIHDIYFVKYSDRYINSHIKEINKFKKIMECCDDVIAHNNIMISKLLSLNIKCRYHNLEIFDYYTECKEKKRKYGDEVKQTIAFAGALTRNPFLQKLDSQKHTYELIVYGSPEIKFKNFVYKGAVNANILPDVIEGNFGLLWADDYEQSETNNYMMYNNPHKMSLYIVSGLPIITWEKYAAAQFVKEYNIGICLESLDQLDETISKIEEADYQEMVKNCIKIRQKLINGDNLVRVIKECLEIKE